MPSPLHYKINQHEIAHNAGANGKFNHSSRINKSIESGSPGPGCYENNMDSFTQSKSFHKG